MKYSFNQVGEVIERRESLCKVSNCDWNALPKLVLVSHTRLRKNSDKQFKVFFNKNFGESTKFQDIPTPYSLKYVALERTKQSITIRLDWQSGI